MLYTFLAQYEYGDGLIRGFLVLLTGFAILFGVLLNLGDLLVSCIELIWTLGCWQSRSAHFFGRTEGPESELVLLNWFDLRGLFLFINAIPVGKDLEFNLQHNLSLKLVNIRYPF